jgi:hypothetical protein
MKVQDSLSIDNVWHTIPDKMENFVGCRIDKVDARKYICKNFTQWQFNGLDKFDEILIWCEQHLGNNFIWDWETIYFKTEADRTVFLLRWS